MRLNCCRCSSVLFAILLLTSIANAQTTHFENTSEVLTIGGIGFGCNPGYERVGNSCQAIELPNNARFYGMGNNWRCTRGYRKLADNCVRILLPRNAKLNIIGNDWVCREGFEASGFSCIEKTD